MIRGHTANDNIGYTQRSCGWGYSATCNRRKQACKLYKFIFVKPVMRNKDTNCSQTIIIYLMCFRVEEFCILKRNIHACARKFQKTIKNPV